MSQQLTARQGYAIAGETGTHYEGPIEEYGETRHTFHTYRMTNRSEWIEHTFDLVPSAKGCLAAKVQAMRAAIFEDVYGGVHPRECPDEACPCRELRKPLADTADEAVAHLRVTERGLTIEEARASLLL